MASDPIRDPKADRLLTPQNAAFIIIDYQPVQVNSIASIDDKGLVTVNEDMILKEPGKDYNYCPTFLGGRDWPSAGYLPSPTSM